MRWSIFRAVPALAAACLALAGCGKSLSSTSGERGSGPIAAVGSQGAGGLSTKNTTRLGGSSSTTDAAAVALAVYPGLTPASRPLAVALVSDEDWPAALAASVLAGSPLRAPILYSEGGTLPRPTSRALARMRPTGVPSMIGNGLLGNAQVIEIGASATPAGYTARSLGSADPAELAVEVERLAALLHHHPPHRLIVVAADGPAAIAMPAAALAAQSGAPILLVDRDSIPRATGAELARLGHTAIYAIGNDTVIDSRVLGQLARYGTVTRIAGSGPASNAIAVARFAHGSFGWDVVEPGHGLAFADAARPFDAPAAAALAATGDYAPLLLLESPTQIPLPLDNYLHDLQPGTPSSGAVHGVYNHGWLIGDERAISAQLQADLDARLELTPRPAAEPPLASAEGTSTQEPAEATAP